MAEPLSIYYHTEVYCCNRGMPWYHLPEHSQIICAALLAEKCVVNLRSYNIAVRKVVYVLPCDAVCANDTVIHILVTRNIIQRLEYG